MERLKTFEVTAFEVTGEFAVHSPQYLHAKSKASLLKRMSPRAQKAYKQGRIQIKEVQGFGTSYALSGEW